LKIEEALTNHLLRAVPLQKNGYPEKYKGAPIISHLMLRDQDVALINEKGRFIYTKDPEIAKMTFTSSTNRSLIFIDDPTLEFQEKVKKSDFIKVKLTKAVLSADVINLSAIHDEMSVSSFSELAMKIFNKDRLNEEQLASLICDPRTHRVFDMDAILKLTDDVELIEIGNQITPRARLFMVEMEQGEKKPLSLSLFKSKLVKKAKKLS